MKNRDPRRGDSATPPVPEPSAVRKPDKPRKMRRRGRSLQVDDVLWYMCFLLTYWFFDIPNTLWFSNKIERHYLHSSLLLLVLFFLISFYLFWKTHPDHRRIWEQFPVLFIFSLLLFFAVISLFCLSAWRVWNVWTLYIVFVTTMTLNATAAISL
uniref:Transmembrane protein 128 n=1 Tax=Steinernema glaseri TaxID=37863 RepID=A0A1I7ZAS7_9BILA